ncbi:MAG: hypothetical protein IJK02_05140 [Clostridia bacterium]|nr:hypothetical protein [Clostridia bacterium]
MRSILYYPSISICDGSWLRNAILYWDKVCSIVPFQGYDCFSPEVLYLQERDIYRPVFPQNISSFGDFTSAANKCFRRYLNNPKLNDYQRGKEQRRIYDPSFYSCIHYNKFPQKTQILLSQCGIHQDKDGYIIMPEFLVQDYMKILAEFAAKYDPSDMVVGTDTIRNLNQLYPRKRNRSTNTVLSIVFNNYLPVPSMDVPFEDLLDFKEARKDELCALWSKISELEHNIATCIDDSHLKSILISFRESWERELEQNKTLFSKEKTKFVWGSLRSFLFAGAAEVLTEVVPSLSNDTPISMKAISASFGISGLIGVGTYCLDYRNKIRSTSKNNGFAYVVSANKHGLIGLNSKIDIIT